MLKRLRHLLYGHEYYCAWVARDPGYGIHGIIHPATTTIGFACKCGKFFERKLYGTMREGIEGTSMPVAKDPELDALRRMAGLPEKQK